MVEEETKKQLSKKASEEHFPSTSEILPVLNDDGSVAAALYKYTVDDTTFRILVTTSWHTIRGHLKTLLAIMNNGQSFLSVMSVLHHAGIVSAAAVEKQRQIFLAQLTETEGLDGDLGKRDLDGNVFGKGSVHKARRVALPKGLGFGNPIRAGVSYVG